MKFGWWKNKNRRIKILINSENMNNTFEKEWPKKVLNLDLQAQSGAIWVDEKSSSNAERKVNFI